MGIVQVLSHHHTRLFTAAPPRCLVFSFVTSHCSFSADHDYYSKVLTHDTDLSYGKSQHELAQ